MPIGDIAKSQGLSIPDLGYLGGGAAASGGGGGLAGLLGKASPLMMATGLVSSIAGGVSGLLAARQMRKLSKQVPQYSRSQFPGQMLGQAQQELNANPFQAAQARANQGRMANRIGASMKAVTDPSQMLNLIGAYSGAAADEALNQDMANYAQRGQRLNDLYNAQMANYREDQNVYDNSMTAFNSKANLLNAANQTRSAAFQNIGGTLLSGGNAFSQFRK